jgi:uncharacterized protein YukE
MRALKKAIQYLLLLALLSFPVVVYFKAQALTDWWQLRGYSPPATVVSLASQDTMSSYARHVFYVNQPDIESSTTQFRADCTQSEKTIVLGCYHSNQAGIFIFNVQDPRLSGVQQVTAAHEMLHAVYDRLSKKDRDYVDSLLMDYYNNQLHDQRILDTINLYKQTEPNDVVNEMHSVFGTEIASLPSPLEQYYARYFTNRAVVAGFASTYQNEFTSREAKITADKAQLDQLKATIIAEESQLRDQSSKINSDRTRLESLRSSGQIAEYNASVNSFNAEVDAYNSSVQTLRANISQYNQLVEEYNAIASELTGLEKALDTRVQTQVTQ